MKRIRAIVELACLWLAITLALAIAVLIIVPIDTPEAAGHVYSGVISHGT